MPYPVNTFANFAQLLAYINQYWITNGVQEITGVIGNDVVNGLLTFIEQSPLNWEKADIVSTGGDVVAARPITVFMTTTPDTLSWLDNIYNEYVFINSTNNLIPLATGYTYYDIDLNTVLSIPAKSTVNIIKAKNNNWIQRSVSSGTGSTSIYPFYITNSDFDVSDGKSYNNPNIVGATLALFPNEYTQQFLLEGSETFSMTSTGFIMNIPGFDAYDPTQNWQIRVERVNS